MVQNDDGGDVIKGTLDLLILKTLQLGPLHGWGITERIEHSSERLLRINQGSLYPALYRLVRRRMITSEWRKTENNRTARYYTLSPAGKRYLAEARADWERLSLGVNLVLQTT
ncbi:MAG: PadR family transcriptional regulator [Gemmatimonadaceae bacterium]